MISGQITHPLLISSDVYFVVKHLILSYLILSYLILLILHYMPTTYWFPSDFWWFLLCSGDERTRLQMYRNQAKEAILSSLKVGSFNIAVLLDVIEYASSNTVWQSVSSSLLLICHLLAITYEQWTNISTHNTNTSLQVSRNKNSTP